MRIMQHLWSSLLRSEIKKIIPSGMRLGAPACVLTTAILMALVTGAVFAGSATWNFNPTSGDWNTATNWTPATVPNGPADTATFDVSNTTGVSLSADTEVNSIVFNAGASPFTITATPVGRSPVFTISGAGITNNSGIPQNFVTEYPGFVNEPGEIFFTNAATAGELTVFNNNSGITKFFDTSSAGRGTFNNNAGSYRNRPIGGETDFIDSSTADNATLISNGGTAEGAIGGITTFQNISTAENATLIANNGCCGGSGGVISFQNDSTGDAARVQLFGGTLDISAHNAPGVTVGSIEGAGVGLLGTNNLTVGSNNLSTIFSGVIQNDGSLTKIGTGKLVLNGNTYTGATEVEAGALVVNNFTGFGTGTGPVEIHAGILAGSGRIAGPVTVGTGAGAGAVLSPGITRARTLTLIIQGPLTLKSDATYKVALNSTHAKADKIVVHGGVMIESGAYFIVLGSGQAVLPPGTVFTVIDNTSHMPITGTFANLGDGSSFTVNGNTFQASYEGGDGNDLTLTVQ